MTKISRDGYEPAHLSFSTISSWRMCGKKFELTKVLRLEEKPGLAAIGGNVVHVCTEHYDLGEWIPSPSASNVVDTISDSASE